MNQELQNEQLMKQKQEQVSKEEKEQGKKEEIAKEFGINLDDIEHVELSDGKEFLKFYNPKDQTVRMVKYKDSSTDINDSYEDAQQQISSSQGEDEKENAENIFEHNLRYKYVELSLIPISELRNNRYKYKKQIDSLYTIERKKLILLLMYSNQLKITYINIENGIALDDNYDVIDVEFDYAKNSAVIKNAKVLNNEIQNELDTDDEDLEIRVDLTDINFDSIVEQFIISSEDNVDLKETTVTINGVQINTKDVKTFSDMPEAIDRAQMNPRKRGILRGLVQAFSRRKAKVASKTNEKQKQLVKKDNNNHGAAA